MVRALTAARVIGWSVWWSPGFGVPLGCGCFKTAAWETELGPSSRQSTEALRSLSFLVAVCVVRTWNLVHCFLYASYLAVTFPVCGVLLSEYSIGFFGRFFSYSCSLFLVRQWIHVLHQYWAFGRIAHIFYVAADSNPDCVSSPFGLNGEECSVDASGCSFAPRQFALGILDDFLELHVTDTCDDGVDFLPYFYGFFGLLFGVEALPIHDCGAVDIHTLKDSSEQQQQQQQQQHQAPSTKHQAPSTKHQRQQQQQQQQ